MLIERIENLKFKKGEEFINNFFKIKNDNIYLTDDFLFLFFNKKDIMNKWVYSGYSLTIKGMYKLTLYFRRIDNNTKYKWLVAGSCGTHGFNGMEYTKKECLGVRVKRQVINNLVIFYLKSNLSRIDKILKLKNKMLC